MSLNGNIEAYLHEVTERAVRNEVRLNNVEPRIDRLEGAFLKIMIAAAGGGSIAGILARFIG